VPNRQSGTPTPAPDQTPRETVLPRPVAPEPSPLSSTRRARVNRRAVSLLLVAVAALLLIFSVGAVTWYNWSLNAPSNQTNRVRVVVKPGDTAATIAANLQAQGLIRSQLAFNLYTKLSGTRDKLQAASYVLSPNQDVQSIVNHMTTGQTDEFDVTIPPGLTLDELRALLIKDGFSDDEITAAYVADYDHPLFAGRPAEASLEGYIFPETYRMNADQDLKTLFTRSFDEFYKLLQSKGYIDNYASKGLNLYQGVTLASIVQKEVSNTTDQKQVAQVFLRRLAVDMPLGSDVTFIYAAKQLGVEATPGLDSPYNTRKVGGLPPGPISNMNPGALDAVANPAAGDYLFFVAGDDGKTYYAHTEAEHEANIEAHCKTLCD
jgi:UPF0755 protein